tara:strand:+ start:369 stop:782 length:414 start_codon:yes stop_codon:yes gene_type:complete
MKIKRKFYTEDFYTGKPIVLVQGEIGYSPITLDPDYSSQTIKDKLLKSNKVYGNTERDVEIALQCSMFGWDILAAKNLTPYKWDMKEEDEYKESEKLAIALDHWAQCFWDGSVYDQCAKQIGHFLSDKAKSLRSNYN